MRLVMMSEVKPGDRVLSADGDWHSVTAVSTHRPAGRKVTVKLWNGTSDLVLTDNHPVLTPVGFQQAGALAKGDVVLERIDRSEHVTNAIDMMQYMRRPKSGKRSNAGLFLGGVQVSEDGQFIRYKNPRATWVRRYVPINDDLMSLLGFYAAEGSCGSHNLQFTFHSEELALHEEVDRLVSDLFGLTMTRSWSKEGKAVTLTVSSYPLRSFFREMAPGTAGEKCLSNVILHAPVSLQKSFLRTYWLGDGSTHGGSFLFTTTSRTLMLQVRTILLRMNIVSSLSTSRRAGGQTVIRGRIAKHNYDLLNIQVAQPESFNTLAVLLRSELRKDNSGSQQPRFAKIKGDFLALTVKAVEVGDWEDGVTVSNLTVDGDHTYTLPSATTHNCDSLAMAAFMSADTGGESAQSHQVVQYSNFLFAPRRRGY